MAMAVLTASSAGAARPLSAPEIRLMSVTILRLPDRDLTDVPRALRALADAIERGEYGDAHNVAWVVDCGDSRIEVGMAGAAPEPGATAHLLFAIAQRKLEKAI